MVLRDGTQPPSNNDDAPSSLQNILVVEEQSTNRMIYGQVAASLGKQVRVHRFKKPTQALLWLKTNSMALIVCNLWMRELDAFEVLAILQGNPKHALKPVIVVTADTRKGLRERVLAAGASDFVISPVPVYELRARLQRLLPLHG